jgi:hypothetical protein
MILSCKEVTRLVSEGQDRRLGLRERLALRLHFAICEGCRNVNGQLAFLRRALRALRERT